MGVQPKGLLFLEVEGATGRSVHSKKHHRHAQLKRQNKVEQEAIGPDTPVAPAPLQIRFKASERSDADDFYVGRCFLCKRRRKLSITTTRCRPCDTVATSSDSGDLAGLGAAGAMQRIVDVQVPAVTRDISFVMFGKPEDRQAMHYFLSFAALDLSGYLPGRFWDGLVLKMSQAEPMIRQAVLAVAGAHLDHCSDVSPSKASLLSYQSAINKLSAYIKNTSEPSPILVLLCCICFFTIDRMRGDAGAAAVHLNSAMAILDTEAQRRKRHKVAVSRHYKQCEDDEIHRMTTMLVQMDIEDTMPQLDRGPLLEPTWLNTCSLYFDQPPEFKFWVPYDYVAPWMRICHAEWTFIGRSAKYRHIPIEEVPGAVIEYRNGLRKLFRAWRLAFKDYIKRIGMPNPVDVPTSPKGREAEDFDRRVVASINALIIQSHYYVLKNVLAESISDITNPHPWDRNAKKMLHTGERALLLRQAYQRMHSLATPKTFSPHVGIAESLLCLSHRTLSPDVRARAQYLIRGFREVSGDLTGVTAFFAGEGAPPEDMVLLYERPGH